MMAACLRILISPRFSDAWAFSYPSSEPLTLITHRGFPSQNIVNNHVAGFIHEAFQREDAVTADEIGISSHTRHHAL